MSHNSFKFLQVHGNPPNSDLSSKQCCPPLEQLGPEFVPVAQGLSLRQPEKLRVFDLRDKVCLITHPLVIKPVTLLALILNQSILLMIGTF